METPAPVPNTANPWRWIPSLYFGQGIPYVVVMTLSVVMYKNLHVSNTDIALYTSWLYLPWVIKPFWSPLVDMFRTKRLWIFTLQFVIGVAFALVALTLPGPQFFKMTLAVFWLMAFSSATHDIAADGFYLLAMPQHQQAAFVGVRSTFYRLATLSAQGGLVYLVGELTERTGDVTRAWMLIFGLLAMVFTGLGIYHFFVLPRPAADQATAAGKELGHEFIGTWISFFRKPGVWATLAFLLLYRFAESQALKLLSPFLLDAREAGGLGLTNKQVGLVYGTVGIAALTVGGLVGGWMISRAGLKRMLWPMIGIMNLPNLAFLYLSWTQPTSLWVVGSCLAIEQFGYGFGFTAYMVYMMMVAEGSHKTAHYAFCTGFMALGMMLPGMPAGWIQDQLGYPKFFLWVMLCTIPSFISAALIKVDPAFGRKQPAA